MAKPLDHSNLHRGAKYFMDSGRALDHDAAMALLHKFGLSIQVGSEVACSALHQTALLTLINVARRAFLAGVEVVGLPDVRSLTRLAPNTSLKEALCHYGGRVVDQLRPDWPSAIVGSAAGADLSAPSWRLTWSGWRGGVIPGRESRHLQESAALPIAPALAAAICASEAFSYHALDHAMAGRRAAGLSLWHPGADWLLDDATEPQLQWLPSALWVIGLGNLGQAFAWLLSLLPFAQPERLNLVLQDKDRLAESNDSTSLLSFLPDVGRRKTRVLAQWLEDRDFEPTIREDLFGSWTRRGDQDPAVAFCGVDNALTRSALEKAGFGLVVEAGLGAGAESFRSLSLHTFPASRSAEEIWSRHVGQSDRSTEDMPAYAALKRDGFDACGLAQLASRTVGVPFVGLTAAALALSELLRRLNGGIALELASVSVAALADIETVPIHSPPYAHGHLPAMRS